VGRCWACVGHESWAGRRAPRSTLHPNPPHHPAPPHPNRNPFPPHPPTPPAPRPLKLFLDLIVYFASRDLHLAAAFSRRFYWSDVIMWPEELPPGSTVVLGAADDLVHADEVGGILFLGAP
jgi:hypothetical protein